MDNSIPIATTPTSSRLKRIDKNIGDQSFVCFLRRAPTLGLMISGAKVGGVAHLVEPIFHQAFDFVLNLPEGMIDDLLVHVEMEFWLFDEVVAC